MSDPAGANKGPVAVGARLLEAPPGVKESPDPEWATG